MPSEYPHFSMFVHIEDLQSTYKNLLTIWLQYFFRLNQRVPQKHIKVDGAAVVKL